MSKSLYGADARGDYERPARDRCGVELGNPSKPSMNGHLRGLGVDAPGAVATGGGDPGRDSRLHLVAQRRARAGARADLLKMGMGQYKGDQAGGWVS